MAHADPLSGSEGGIRLLEESLFRFRVGPTQSLVAVGKAAEAVDDDAVAMSIIELVGRFVAIGRCRPLQRRGEELDAALLVGLPLAMLDGEIEETLVAIIELLV